MLLHAQGKGNKKGKGLGWGGIREGWGKEQSWGEGAEGKKEKRDKRIRKMRVN